MQMVRWNRTKTRPQRWQRRRGTNLVLNCARRTENSGKTKAGRINNESRYREFSSWLFIAKIGLAVMEAQLHLVQAASRRVSPRNRSGSEITSSASKDNRGKPRRSGLQKLRVFTWFTLKIFSSLDVGINTTVSFLPVLKNSIDPIGGN